MHNRQIFWLIWALGLLPMLLAILVYVTRVGVPVAQVNSGQLIQPIVPLQEWGGRVDQFTSHWSLLLVHEHPCRKPCMLEGEKLRRVHDALGRDSDRVRVRVLDDFTLESGVWVVDPKGNLVLHYGHEYEGAALLSDLRRLLKASRLG